MVAQVPFHLTENGDAGEGGEAHSSQRVKTVDRLHQAQSSHLHEIVPGLTPVPETPGQMIGQAQMVLDQLLA